MNSLKPIDEKKIYIYYILYTTKTNVRKITKNSN